MSSLAERTPATEQVPASPFDGVEPWKVPDFDGFRLEQLTEVARVRPQVIIPLSEDAASKHADSAADELGAAVLVRPDDLSPAARRVAFVLTLIASRRLLAGDSVEYALTIAAGRDLVRREMEDLPDDHEALNRRTIARALVELVDRGVIDRVGQMRAWEDDHGAAKTGAWVYRLRVTFQRVGVFAARVAERTARALTRSYAAIGGEGRAQACLRAAIRHAKVGQRNGLGHWLACRCRQSGLDQAMTMRLLATYRESVPDPRSYEPREVRATVRSVFRRVAA